MLVRVLCAQKKAAAATPKGTSSAMAVRNSLMLQTLELGDGIDELLEQLANKSAV